MKYKINFVRGTIVGKEINWGKRVLTRTIEAKSKQEALSKLYSIWSLIKIIDIKGVIFWAKIYYSHSKTNNKWQI